MAEKRNWSEYNHMSFERKRYYARQLQERRSPPPQLAQCPRCPARVPVEQMPAHASRCLSR